MEIEERKVAIAFTVWYDIESGEIDDVEESSVFAEEGNLTRLDVMKDTVIEFMERYGTCRVYWDRDLKESRNG